MRVKYEAIPKKCEHKEREKECEILLRENVDLVPGARVKYFLLDRLTESMETH